MANSGTTIGGAMSGAVAGATMGSTAGPVGTALGGIIGAVAGGASASLKAREDEKRRQAEIKRLQMREDNAQRRAIADSLAGGVDPRSLDKPVNPANAQSVEPYQETDQSGNLVDSFSGASNVLNNRFINEARIQDSAINSLNDAYKERKNAAQMGLNDTDRLIEEWANDFKESTITENETEKAFSTRMTSDIKRLTRNLSEVKISKERKAEILAKVRDSEGTKDSSKTSIGGEGDMISAVAGMVDNIAQSAREDYEEYVKSKKEVPVTGPKEEPKPRPVYTNPETGEKHYPKTQDGKVFWKGPRTQDGRPAYKDKNGQLRPLEFSRETPKVDAKSSSIKEDKVKTGKREDESTKKREGREQRRRKRIGISANYEDYEENWDATEKESSSSAGGSNLVGFTDSEIREICKAYTKEKFRIEKGKNATSFTSYDFESKLLKFENLAKLELKRNLYLREYRQSPMDFFNENYTDACEFYKRIYNPYKFFRK